MSDKTKFQQALELDVNAMTEKKNGLTYLSWSPAWREFKKIYPDATYEVQRYGENSLPYVVDETGYLVATKVTADGETHEMWLPVMDYKNKAMKRGEATMFDVNKAIMRCFTKNLAMFGLGLYIYAGEDLPELSQEDVEAKESLIEDLKAKADEITDVNELRKFLVDNSGHGKEFEAYVIAKGKKLAEKQE